MKKHLLTVLLSCLAVISLRADVVYKDGFNYFDGPIIVNGTNADGSTNWFHTGASTSPDFLIKNHKAEISASSPGSVPRSEDVHCNFSTFTNAQTIMYASFTVNCTNLPPVTGTYFAHFFANTSGFHARVFAQSSGIVVSNTWRLGISAGSGTVNKIFPVDLAPNTDYQVVIRWNPTTDNSIGDTLAATLWVNPTSTNDLNFITGDSASAIGTADAVGFGFRQAGSFGSFFGTISNLVCATTWDEAATNVWATNAVAPVVAKGPASQTNFVGDSFNLSAVGAGQGLSTLTYQWQKNGANVGGNSPLLSFVSSSASDSGNYRVIVTTPYGLSATSAVAFLWVTNQAVAPTVVPATNTAITAFYHQNLSLHVTATGPQPYTYQWYYTNAPATGANVSGADSDTLSIVDLFTNNGTAGAYYAVVSNPFGSTTSGVFTITVAGPPAVSIAYLRTLVDPTTFAATNSNLRFQATGTITTFANLTSGDTSSYYLQDSTAAINIFVTPGHDFRPPQGASVTFVGWLSSFNGVLELEANTNDVSTSFFFNTNLDGTIISNALPAPKVIPFSVTNDVALAESLEGYNVMLTNVYFGTNEGHLTLGGSVNTSVTVTNGAGQAMRLVFSVQDSDVTNRVFPAFAYSVIGVFNQDSAGYLVEPTRWSDIVTDAPPAVTASIAHTGDTTTLTWTNVPWDNVNYSYGSNYSYSVLASENIAGPYTPVKNFQATMRGVNEVPANVSTGTGFGTVSLSADQTTITVNMRFSGLTAPASAAHIHGPAGAGTNASVLFPFTGVPAATSGAIPEQSFAITPTQLGYLTNGLLYMNVHNSVYTGGELRDQIRLVSAVGLTTPNTSLTNTSPVVTTFNDREATNTLKFYRISSP